MPITVKAVISRRTVQAYLVEDAAVVGREIVSIEEDAFLHCRPRAVSIVLDRLMVEVPHAS